MSIQVINVGNFVGDVSDTGRAGMIKVNDNFAFLQQDIDDKILIVQNQVDDLQSLNTKLSASINFGSSPEENIQATISNANVKTTSMIVITPSGEETADHDPDDYFLEQASAYATNIIDGAFDIIASVNDSFGIFKFNILIIN